MALTLKELKGTDRVEDTIEARSPQKVRLLKVIATGTDAQTFRPGDYTLVSGFPRLGDVHPQDGSLVLRSITGEYDDDSHTSATYTLVYSWPHIGTSDFPRHERNRTRVRVSAESRETFWDRSGNPLGNPWFDEVIDERTDQSVALTQADYLNPDAQLGATLRFPRVQIDLELKGLQTFNPLWTLKVGHVNSEPMPIWGADARMIEFVGVDAEEQITTVPNTTAYRVTLHFVAGLLTVIGPDGNPIELHADEVLDVKWRKRVQDDRVVIEPISVQAVPVKPLFDLNLLIPG